MYGSVVTAIRPNSRSSVSTAIARRESTVRARIHGDRYNGSKKEGITVASEDKAFLHIQADAVTWVKDHVETRRQMRRTRRGRNCPHRQPRANRRRNHALVLPS